MFPHSSVANLPAIVVSETEALRLSNLAAAAVFEGRSRDAAATLLDEMDRADVVPDSRLPDDVVRMNSVVDCEIDGKTKRTVELVFPGAADIDEGKISILSPAGAALIGLSPGQIMSWQGHDGRRHSVCVIAVGEPARA